MPLIVAVKILGTRPIPLLWPSNRLFLPSVRLTKMVYQLCQEISLIRGSRPFLRWWASSGKLYNYNIGFVMPTRQPTSTVGLTSRSGTKID